MSFIIQGVDLPKDSDVYILAICEKGDVYIKDGLSQYVPLRGARAVQIPKGHGDIKDMDTVNTWGWERPCEQSLENAPTILDKERE